LIVVWSIDTNNNKKVKVVDSLARCDKYSYTLSQTKHKEKTCQTFHTCPISSASHRASQNSLRILLGRDYRGEMIKSPPECDMKRSSKNSKQTNGKELFKRKGKIFDILIFKDVIGITGSQEIILSDSP
jgi:hypothetical protein